jgi:N-acetylgalactosamine PTS system EIIB component
VTVALTRVDDRLVHGQVVLAWGPRVGAARILVADDHAAETAWEKDLLAASAGDLGVEVFPAAETAEHVNAERSRPEAAILLFRSPKAAWTAVESGAAFDEINLGGLHYGEGKERVLDYVYLDGEDRAALSALLARGVRLVAQDVPSSRAVDAREWLDTE